MNSTRRFAVTLAGFFVLYWVYGLQRLSLGVDFTDEGVYLAWPLRTLFGEAPFAGDPLLALRPLFNHLSLIRRLHPEISVYEFRMLGWLVHLGAFGALSTCLFQLSGTALQSILIASVPLFVCHIFGLAAPSYNSFACDFLLIGLSLIALSGHEAARHPRILQVAAGLALFVATLAHPGLGLVAAVIGLNEIVRHNLVQNLFRLRPAVSNTGFLTFSTCWTFYFLQLLATGAAGVWLERSVLYRSARVSSFEGDTGRFFLDLLTYPFTYDLPAVAFSIAALAAIVSLWLLARTGKTTAAGNIAAALALLLIVALIRTFSLNPDQLPVAFAMVALVVIIAHLGAPSDLALAAGPPLRLLLAGTTLGALIFAIVTFYFSPLRSWISGILALPFAFGVGLTLLLRSPSGRYAPLFRLISIVTLALAVACVAREHYRFIYRDATPGELTATFRTPKLRHLRSTPERAQAVDELYDYLHPKLTRGEPLLAFDDCPMLYVLFDARPAYGLTWATRYTQTPASLARLDAELRSRPLPRYAIRTVVGVWNPAWAPSPPIRYDHYPLNETVTTHYELERTIFPFEIWRLKSPASPR